MMIDNNEQKVEKKDVNEQVNNQVDKIEHVEQKKERGRGTFYGIIAFAVFIIMAVGATFAYFTASTSSAEGSVNAGSTSFSLDFISYTSAWSSNALIPVATNIVEYSVEQRPDSSNHVMCKDDNNRDICSAYVFQVKNNAEGAQNVSVKLSSSVNSFSNLTAMIYEISKSGSYVETAASDDPDFAADTVEYEDGDHVQVQDSTGAALFEYEPIYINRLGVTKTLLSVGSVKSVAVAVPAVGAEDVVLADNITLPSVSSGNNLKSFLVVLYINENDENQNSTDASKTFSGRVIVEGADGSSRISGQISTADDSVLQNPTTSDTTPETPEP